MQNCEFDTILPQINAYLHDLKDKPGDRICIFGIFTLSFLYSEPSELTYPQDSPVVHILLDGEPLDCGKCTRN
jgi:hypothetical protein